MKLDHVFKKIRKSGESGTKVQTGTGTSQVPEGLLRKCNHCGGAIFTEEVKNNAYICPKCGGYFRLPARLRIASIADEGSFEEWDSQLPVKNPMNYRGYPEKIQVLREKTGLDEAILTGKAKIDGMEVALGVCDGRFLMASMGEAVGEKIARAAERAKEQRLPLILFSCSGGARMQEGITSLMQMAKTSAAIKRHSEAGLLYISVLTDPTTGGVTASFAMLGDILLAEPGALIGFAGPRVIEQTIRQKLPEGFQRSEFLLEHGFLDAIVPRTEMKETLSKLLRLHERHIGGVESVASEGLSEMPPKTQKNKADAWNRVLLSRKKDRPVGSDYIGKLFSDFMEMHGDRLYGDDAAIIGGLAHFHGMPVTVIAQEKGCSTKENIRCNFGMPKPEGYRKALRLFKQAEKFHRPVICLVDTPGAFCGIEAEERGQGEAIARNLYELSDLKTPVLSIVIGEGGSGGALALAVADEVWMLENAVYSILSPEGFASILWKDSTRAKEAAAVMQLTAGDLLQKEMIEKVIPEPEIFTQDSMEAVMALLEREISCFLEEYGGKSTEELLTHRYERFRR